MSKKLSATDLSFKRVIDLRPTVPQLQRNYSWTQHEWSDLWDDLTGFIDDSETRDRPYFIGTIVLEERSNENRILDGQQRLATLTILLGVLTQKLKEVGATDNAVIYELQGLGNPLKPEEHYLTLNQYDYRFFRDYVQRRKYDTAVKFDSHKKIRGADLYYRKKIEEALPSQADPTKWLETLCAAIIDRFTFVCVTSPPDDSYQVFRVLNDRGKNLSQLDLFRTYLLDQVSPERRDEVAEDWTQILDIQSPGSSLDLLRYYWIGRFGDVKALRLARDIEKKIKNKTVSADDIAFELFFYSDIYKKLISPTATSGFTNEEIVLLSSLLDYRANALLPLLMKATFLRENSEGVDHAEFNRLLRMSLAIYVRYTVIGNNDNSKLESLVYGLTKDLGQESVDAILARLRAFAREKNLSDEQFKKEFATASVERDATAKALLRAIETSTYNHSERAIPSSSELHLEHIYPRNPAEKDKMAEHDAYVWRLGNLTIVDGQLNKRMSNKAFPLKKKDFEKSEIGMTNALTKFEQWGRDEIDARQVALAEAAINVWRVDI